MSNKSYRYGEKPKDEWMGRIVSILDEARANTVRSINTQMVTAYWLIGREIVLEEQKGDARAEYGKQLIRSLSLRLTGRFGKGFSLASIKLFRQFYQIYQDGKPVYNGSRADVEIDKGNNCNTLVASEKKKATQCVAFSGAPFSPDLGWSHYRVLMRIENATARQFYDQEVRAPDDNPTVGLLLCTAKNDAVVRYILGEGNQQIFASRYQMELPSLEELQNELQRERNRVEEEAALYGASI